MKYLVSYYVRKPGAIGLEQILTDIAEADDELSAFQKVREKHQEKWDFTRPYSIKPYTPQTEEETYI